MSSSSSPFNGDIMKGKVALITGGGYGIGFEISSGFGKHGASVAIMGRRKAVLDAAVSQLESLGISGDEDAKRAVESTFRHFGKLDILVNFLASAEDLSLNGFEQFWISILLGHSQCVVKHSIFLRKEGEGGAHQMVVGGTILNISATLHYTAAWYQIHVCASKK